MDDNYCGSWGGGAFCMEVLPYTAFVPNANVSSSSLRSLSILTCHLPDHRAKVANDKSRESARAGVPNDTEPAELGVRAHLGSTVDHPCAHAGGEEGEG